MEPDAGRLPPHSWKPSSQEAGNHRFSRAVESACMTQLSYMALAIYSTHGATGPTATEHGTRPHICRAKLAVNSVGNYFALSDRLPPLASQR